MQEGSYSLMQLAKTSSKLAKFSKNGGLYIVLLTDPTTGGISASIAMLGDVILSEPNALIGFAGPRVIKQTIGQDLPEGFQGIPELHKIIMESDMAASFSKEYKSSKNKLSDKIVEAIERGMKYTSVEYNDALSKIDTANIYFKQFF